MKSEPIYATIKPSELENNFIYNSVIRTYQEFKREGFEPTGFDLEYIQESNKMIIQYNFLHDTKVPSLSELEKIIEKTGATLENAFQGAKI